MYLINAFLTSGVEVIISEFRYKKLLKELNLFLIKSNQTLSPKLAKRIRFYMIQSAITNLWFSTLRGYSINKNEALSGQYLGALTPVYDDLMDNYGLTHEQITNNKDLNTSQEKVLFDYLFTNLLNFVSNQETFIYYFKKLGNAQNHSLKQNSIITLSKYQIKQITYDKGGYATLLYRSILDHPLLDGEEEAIYHLGALLQITNDLFDSYKDAQSQTQTLATIGFNVDELTNEFIQLKDHTIHLFLQLGYDEKNIRGTIYQMVSVMSRGKVYLEHLKNIQKGSFFKASDFSRNELMVDMEKWPTLKINYAISKKWMDDLLRSNALSN